MLSKEQEAQIDELFEKHHLTIHEGTQDVVFYAGFYQAMQEYGEWLLSQRNTELIEKIEKMDWECFEQTFIKKDIINLIKE